MPRRCNMRTSATGRAKTNSYAVGHDGKVTRLTRSQVISGNLPEGTSHVVMTPAEDVPRSQIASGEGLLKLSKEEAQAITRKRGGALPRGQDLAFQARVTGTFRKYDDDYEHAGWEEREVEVEAHAQAYEIAGGRYIFGGLPGVEAPEEGIETLPRNPYILSGHAAGSAEGDEAALAYTAALVALNEARPCPQDPACRHTRTCRVCVEGVADGSVTDVRKVAHLLPQGRYEETDVDALMLASRLGDAGASGTLRSLALAGEMLMSDATRGSELMKRESIRSMFELEEPEFQAFIDAEEQAAQSRMKEARERIIEHHERADQAAVRLREMESDARRKLEEESGVPPFELRPSSEERRRIAAMVEEMDGGINREIKEKHEKEKARAQREYKEADLRAKDLRDIAAARSYNPKVLEGEGLVLIHESPHEIEETEDGSLILRPRGDWEEDGIRDTLHFSLNHRASGHVMRTGSGAGHFLAIPLEEVLGADAGSLSCMSPVDMQLTPGPGQGIRIPAGGWRKFEYTSREPEERDAQVQEVVREGGAVPFPAGSHYSSAEAGAVVRVLAAYHGVGMGLHSSSAAGYAESALSGEYGEDRGLGGAEGIPHGWSFFAADMRSLGRNGRLRLFNRGGEGRESVRQWPGMWVRARPAEGEGEAYNF